MAIKGNSGMRSSFSGTVTLGLVSFPVKFVVATKENGVSFHQLHGKCSSRIQQKVYCPVCAVNVERADLVRGFEVEKDRNVTISDAALAKIDPEGDKAIEVVEFAPLASLDALNYTGGVYYLAVDHKQPCDAYRVIAAAMACSKVAAVVSYTRNKVRYAVIEARDGLLVMFDLHYAGAIRSAADVPQPDDSKPDKAQVELAKELIAGMTIKTPTLEHADSYVDAVNQVVAESTHEAAKSGKPTLTIVPTRTDNLMVLLQATMKAKKNGSKKAAA